jgi:hypothetical protein
MHAFYHCKTFGSRHAGNQEIFLEVIFEKIPSNHFHFAEFVVADKTYLGTWIHCYVAQGKSPAGIYNASRVIESDLNLLHPQHTFRMVYTDTGLTRANASTAMQQAAIDSGALAMVGDLSSRYATRSILLW